METAQTVIESALQEILLQANESDIESADFSIAVRYMNRYMDGLASRGVSLGYTTVTNAADIITIPNGAIEGLVFNLALRLAPQYDIEPTPYLRESAASGLDAMRKIAISVQPTQPPCTLPIGSGNEGDANYTLNHFYQCPDDEVTTERDGSIILENQTNDQ